MSIERLIRRFSCVSPDEGLEAPDDDFEEPPCDDELEQDTNPYYNADDWNEDDEDVGL